MVLKFTGSFTQQESIPEKAIDAAIAVMRHGRLHRYNVALGEIAETVLLEQEFHYPQLIFIMKYQPDTI